MEVLFSAVEDRDEELAKQVAKDIESAKAKGSVDTDEVKYENIGDGKVSVTDKGNGEVTIVEKADDEDDTYDMYPAFVEQSEQIEGYLHPEVDGVTPGNQVGARDEYVEDHFDGKSIISPNLPDGGLNPDAGYERSVEEVALQGPDYEEKEFSVSTNNSVVLRIFSDQEFCERIFSEVIESEETTKVGDLKVEKVGDDEVVVTSETTGDQAAVKFDEGELEITELESKNFSEEEQFEPLFVVGVDPVNYVIVDAPEYDEESAQELAQSLMEKGVSGVQIFDNPEDAREYAINLLNNLGVESDEDIEEPVQAEFSDHTVYLTEFNANNTDLMCRLFSESADCLNISATQDAIEDAISNGDEIETDTEIITPIDSKTAVIEDKDSGEFTKVELDGEEMELEKIDEDQAEELTDHLVVSDEEDEDEDEEEKEFSDIWCDEAETKFFSEHEEMTEYMTRLFSEESESAEIEDAIESGEQIENDTEIITPVDFRTAVIEDKVNGEFTKAEMDNEVLDLEPISEAEADNLTNSLAVVDKVENHEGDDEEKEFSDIWCDEAETKFFSEHEEMTEYMVRLFSEESDHSDIEEAIESGKKVETDTEIITPISGTEAIIEDKENGEFTKAEMDDEEIECHPLTEEEADELEESSKEFSEGDYDDPVLNKFFSDMVATNAPAVEGAVPVPAGQVDPNTPVIPLADPNAAPAVVPVSNGNGSVEAIEDKALQAVQSIQAVAEEAAQQIMEAKQAPAQVQEQDLQEAQFCEKKFSDTNDTLVSWLNGNSFNK